MRTHLRFPALGFCAVLAACGGDGTGAGGATLTAAEAAALNEVMIARAAEAGGGMTGGPLGSVGAANAESSLTLQVDQTERCEPDGNVRVRGTLTVASDEQTTALDADLSVAHDDCAHPTEHGVIRVSGDPDLDLLLAAVMGPEGLTSLTLSETGAFTWSRTGASGRCTVDVHAALDPASGLVEYTGTFCGFPVQGSVPAA